MEDKDFYLELIRDEEPDDKPRVKIEHRVRIDSENNQLN